MVSAWASASRLVVGHVAAAEQSNEITAIPALLRVLDLAGATVTSDALGGQTAIAAPIVAQGADDVLASKKHHPTLHEEVALHLRPGARAKRSPARQLAPTTP